MGYSAIDNDGATDAFLEGYRCLLAADAAATPLGSLLRSRALGSLGWLTEDRAAAAALLRAQLFPLLVAAATRAAPLELPISRDEIALRLVTIETAARELAACRRLPDRLLDGTAPRSQNRALLGQKASYLHLT